MIDVHNLDSEEESEDASINHDGYDFDEEGGSVLVGSCVNKGWKICRRL